MSLRFDRPVGANGDVKELEYVSALHQTDQHYMRTDGSIRDADIQLFLKSRYGIQVTEDEVRDKILRGMGGGSGDDECIDMMELAAILLIPTLLKAANQECDVPSNSKLLLPQPELLRFVLSMILQDVTGSAEPKVLTPTLVKDILKAYGENELADNDKLVHEMVQQARQSSVEGSKNEVLRLDSKAFARALTDDVRLYDVNNEIRLSSNYDDVFLTYNDNDSGVVAGEEDDEELGRVRKTYAKYSNDVNHEFTAPSIDFVASTYRSKSLTVILWATFIVTYFAYDYNTASTYAANHHCEPYNYSASNPWIDNIKAISCQIVTDLYSWLIVFAIASSFGLLLVGFGSFGNSSDVKWYGSPLIGAIVVFWLSFAPFKYLHFSDDNTLSHKYLRYVALALGMSACLLHLCHSVILLIPRQVRRIKGLKYLFAAGTLRGEAHVKRAAAYKLTGMVQNARDILKVRDLDGVVDTNFGQGLIAFSKHGNRFREEGGFCSTWSSVLNNKIVKEEGIWYSARLLASNISQYIVAVFVLLAGIALTHRIAQNYNPADAQHIVESALQKAVSLGVSPKLLDTFSSNLTGVLSDFLTQQSVNLGCGNYTWNQTQLENACQFVDGTFQCDRNAGINYLCAFANVNSTLEGANATAFQLGLLAASGFDTLEAQTAFQHILQHASNSGLVSLYPAVEYMVVLPMAVATGVAFLVALYLAAVYLPSHTSTVLQLRSGVIPTLKDRNFYRLRFAPDQVTLITGSIFWGSFISSVIAGGLAGLVVFIFVWQVTVFMAQRLVAIVIGLLTVFFIKLVILVACRCTLYKAFYRRKPAIANISAMAWECSHFAISVGFVFFRVVKLIATASIYIGRIDTPFLAPGVGKIGPLELDYYPYIYRKDILATDAHRHPYIETLGVMYLMKLRYGEHFGNTAGSCWRLLFVYALMPWLHKYRIQARPHLLLAKQRLVDVETFSACSLTALSDEDVDDDDEDLSKLEAVSQEVLSAKYDGGNALLRKKLAEALKENEKLKMRMEEMSSNV